VDVFFFVFSRSADINKIHTFVVCFTFNYFFEGVDADVFHIYELITCNKALYVSSDSCFFERYFVSRKQVTNVIRRVENDRDAALRVRAAFSQLGSDSCNSLFTEASWPSRRLIW